MENSEKRKNTRVAFQTSADIKFADASYSRCETENLSVKGVSVLGITGRQIGEKCELALSLSGSTSELRLEMKGEIVRVEENGIALHFTDIDLDSFYHLKNIVYYNSEDPDSMQSEFPD
jgi:hypothetical protein